MRITTILTTETINGTEVIKQSFEGTLQRQGGLTLLTYEEPEHGTTRLFIGDGHARLVRKGRLTTQMVFQPETTTHNWYHTPNGSFEMEIHTTLFQHHEAPSESRFCAHYTLALNGEQVAKNKLEIRYDLNA
jgi:uncharacterized beta-barrel protein YwiB (DUF1934 family)